MAEAAERTRDGMPVKRALADIEALLDRWDPSPRSEQFLRTLANDGELGCVSCTRVGSWSPVHRTGLCRFCGRLLKRLRGEFAWSDELPPAGLVKRHADGKRILLPDIERHLKHDTASKKGARR